MYITKFEEVEYIMRKIKKLAVFLVISVLLICCISLTAFAATGSQDGLSVEIKTDKDTYSATEQIKVEIIVTNTNSFTVENVTIESILPEGLELKFGTLSNASANLAAGETAELSAVAVLKDSTGDKDTDKDKDTSTPAPTDKNKDKDTSTPAPTDKNKDNGKSPNTGDSSNIIFWVVVLVLSAISVLLSFKYRKKITRVLSLILCVSLLTGALGAVSLLSVAAAESKSFQTAHSITIEKKSYDIKTTVKYTKLGSDDNAPVISTNTASFLYDQSLDAYFLTEETNGFSGTLTNSNKVLDFSVEIYNDKNQLLQEKDISVGANWNAEGIGLFLGKNKVLFKATGANNAKYTQELTVFNMSEDNLKKLSLDDKDDDQDGLLNMFEDYYGSDKNVADTDGDGLFDYIEVAFLALDPTKADTDGNGINDGEEDTDGDGIKNIDEIVLSTDPSQADTDFDGLKDGEEVSIHNTDPTNVDTDGDGASDGKEIEIGTDPLVAQQSFAVTISAENNNDTVTPSVALSLSGSQIETLFIEPASEILFNDDMPGYLGKAYDFNVDGNFDSATINFEFDSSLSDSKDDFVICYFDEENQELIELETTITGNVASAVVSHFSTYILVNRMIRENAREWYDIWDSEAEYTGVEIVFVIDDSGSMDWNDPYYERLNVAGNLIDNLPVNSKIGLVRFAQGYGGATGALTPALTTDKDAVKNYLTRTYFNSPGGTDMYTGINAAFPLFSTTESTILRLMVVLSDGETDDTYLHSSVINTANSKNIRIYTVGLGSSTSYFTSYMQPLAENTNATFYLASDAAELSNIYKDISKKIDLEADGDNDGIPDYYEDHMVSFNGTKIKLDKNNPDTDGDGLLDGKEVSVQLIYNADKTKVYIKGKITSRPDKADSDDDGYNDKQDKNPLKWDVSHRDLAICADLSYQDLAYGSKLTGGVANELKGWSVLDGWQTGFSMNAVEFKKDDSVIIAYRGTYEKIRDWFNNGTTWLLGLSTQTGSAKKLIKKSMDTYKGKNFYITGHSLGGNLAYNAGAEALNKNSSAVKEIVTFNGLGLTIGLTLFGDVWDEAQLMKHLDKITNYKVEGDPVYPILGTFHYGTTYEIKQNYFEGGSPAHSLTNFFNVLEPKNR